MGVARERMLSRVVVLAAVMLLAGCGPGVPHGPADPSTDRNPLTGSTGSGR